MTDLDWNFINAMREKRKLGFSQKDVFQQEDSKLTSVLDGLEEANTEMDKNQIPRISESLFKSRYLKAFFGVGDSVEDNFAVYLEWTQEISRHFNLPVYVCSDINPNDILFSVPPVTNVNIINPAKADSRAVNTSISMAKEAGFLQPLMKQKLMQDALENIFSVVMDKNKIVTDDQKQWSVIYERYKDILVGLPTVGKTKFTPQVDSQTTEEKAKPAQQTQVYKELDEGF